MLPTTDEAGWDSFAALPDDSRTIQRPSQCGQVRADVQLAFLADGSP